MTDIQIGLLDLTDAYHNARFGTEPKYDYYTIGPENVADSIEDIGVPIQFSWYKDEHQIVLALISAGF